VASAICLATESSTFPEVEEDRQRSDFPKLRRDYVEFPQDANPEVREKRLIGLVLSNSGAKSREALLTLREFPELSCETVESVANSDFALTGESVTVREIVLLHIATSARKSDFAQCSRHHHDCYHRMLVGSRMSTERRETLE
jgi:hypothetical protein